MSQTEEKYALENDRKNGYGTENGTEFKDVPVEYKCQHCGTEMTTELDYEVGRCSWITFGICCAALCWLGCCLIPFVLTNVKDVIHKCSNCKAVVGTYRRKGCC